MAPAAAASILHIPLGEYLGSVYRPDVDYVDGYFDERNVGEIDHATVQKIILLALTVFEESARVYAIQELRVQVLPTRFRVPDICLLQADRLPSKIITEPPLLCVEVLSTRDTVADMRNRCLDYIHMGVPEVWMFGPETESAYVLREGEFFEAGENLLLGKLGVSVNVRDLYAAARRRLGNR